MLRSLLKQFSAVLLFIVFFSAGHHSLASDTELVFVYEVQGEKKGTATLRRSADEIVITTKDLGETDGTMTFSIDKEHEVSAEWAANYTQYVGVPIESGTVIEATLTENDFEVQCQIYILTTDKDTRGHTFEVLLLSLNRDLPTPLGTRDITEITESDNG